MNIPEWLISMQVGSMIFCGILFLITVGGGWFMIKGLESLKSDMNDDETTDA